MNEDLKLYFEFDEYRKKHGEGRVDAFIHEKIKALGLDGFSDEAYELVAKALCDTVHTATENLKAILAPGEDVDVVAQKRQTEALSELRNAIGNDEDIPKEKRMPLFKMMCSWWVGRSWEDTKGLATEVMESGASPESLPEDFRSSALADKEMPDGVADTIQETAGFLCRASHYNMLMAQGAISGRVVNVIENTDENVQCILPVIVRDAFESDILSGEEECLKKLVALERLLFIVRQSGRDALLSPLVVVGIARDAFVHVNDTKATIKELQEQSSGTGEKEAT